MDKTIGIYVLKTFVAAVGLTCLYGLRFPRPLAGWVTKSWNKPASPYISVLTRLLIGALLLWVASETKFPQVFTFFGYFTFAAAMVILLLGRKRVGQFLLWYKDLPPIALRLWFGLSLILCYLVFFYGT